MKIIVSLILILICSVSYGQITECNQQCKGGQNDIPKGICIPQGQHIREIFKKGDINKDGLKDFIISHSNVNEDDGDIVFLSMYYALPDSSFVLKKTNSNLYPVIFKKYTYNETHYNNLTEQLQYIHSLYSLNYPLIGINFLDGEIILKVGQEIEYQTLHFIYNNKKDNWFLKRSEFLLEIDDYRETGSSKYFGDERISIDEFNYIDWL